MIAHNTWNGVYILTHTIENRIGRRIADGSACVGAAFEYLQTYSRIREDDSVSEDSSQGKQEQYHHGDLRRALVEASLEIVEEHGISGLSLRKIARRVGVTHAAPYRHFDDKAELLAAMAQEGLDGMHDYMLRHLEEAGDAADERLLALGVAYVRFATEKPSHFRVMFGPQVGDRDRFAELDAAYDRTFELLFDAVADCQEAGVLREGSTLQHARTCWALVHGLSSMCVNGLIPVDDPDEAERLTRKAAAGLWYGLSTEGDEP